VNRELIAKAIGELTFEEVLSPSAEGEHYTFVSSSNAVWKFKAVKGIWGSLKVDPQCITRNNSETYEASDFFLDIQKETGMDDIILGNFFEEMHNTLLADFHLKKASMNVTSVQLSQMNGEEQQRYLNGHPKILLSKGRVGWKASEREAYSPESAKPFQLFWIEVKGIRMPVHPWQWDRFISTQFVGEIAKGEIVPLGLMGDYYLPQTSIRTLSNVTDPKKPDVKLPLSILNTSCIRGLPSKYVETGKLVSKALEAICEKDEKLKSVKVLKDLEGITAKHEAFSKVKNAPYRYHELLGSVMRESAQSKLANDEKAILTASLYHQDHEGRPLIAEYIKLSGKSTEEWLKAFFKHTLIPLLHLQIHYGVGIVAHGQNIVLILKNNFPSGMILKDFHGDLRLSSVLPEQGEKVFGTLKTSLTSLPPHYLIHDLITGSFITVHRFISLVMKETMNVNEETYYGLIREILKSEPGAEKILRPEFEKLLLNKVRFKIGYGDSDERPLPMLGGPLKNPIYKENIL
jgi:aerobactin synthase